MAVYFVQKRVHEIQGCHPEGGGRYRLPLDQNHPVFRGKHSAFWDSIKTITITKINVNLTRIQTSNWNTFFFYFPWSGGAGSALSQLHNMIDGPWILEPRAVLITDLKFYGLSRKLRNKNPAHSPEGLKIIGMRGGRVPHEIFIWVSKAAHLILLLFINIYCYIIFIIILLFITFFYLYEIACGLIPISKVEENIIMERKSTVIIF